MWDACKFYPRNGINVLVLRSLVKIGDENELRMHDQLRDLGREIVREENIKEPGKRSRLWLHKAALKILKRRKVISKCIMNFTLCFVFFLFPHLYNHEINSSTNTNLLQNS